LFVAKRQLLRAFRAGAFLIELSLLVILVFLVVQSSFFGRRPHDRASPFAPDFALYCFFPRKSPYVAAVTAARL
jgi:hypothetical protein